MEFRQDQLVTAAADFRHLLDRGYPRRASLTLVGNRYDLEAEAREILHRGVFAPAEARGRRAKLLAPEKIRGRELAVDAHNVIITVESALLGRPLVLADDGVVRDIARLSSRYRPSQTTDRALHLIVAALKGLGVGRVDFWLDQRMSKSGELAAAIREKLSAVGLPGDARAVLVPEKELAEHPGPTATSDSALMDQVAAVFDLAGHIAGEKAGRAGLIDLSAESSSN
ncbi:MAG: DUF434 domain-containing protein [Proteobacteria bacterium]|nr:DUF434 domain-containing protein [Pseudomonadota bacterium]